MKKSIIIVWTLVFLFVSKIVFDLSKNLNESTFSSTRFQDFKYLNADLQKDVLKLCDYELCKVDKFLNDSISIMKFINCNIFCKKFILRDITFDEYLNARIFIIRNNFSLNQFFIQLFIIWNNFFIKKFNREMKFEEYKKLLIFKSEIFEYEDFCNFLNFDSFFRDMNLEEYQFMKSFYIFCKKNFLDLNQDELNHLLIVYLNLGLDNVQLIYDCYKKNNLNFKKVMFLFYDWIISGNIIEKDYLTKDYLIHILEINKIYKNFYKQDITYSIYRSICLKSTICKTVNLSNLMSMIYENKIKPKSEKKHLSSKNKKLVRNFFLSNDQKKNILFYKFIPVDLLPHQIKYNNPNCICKKHDNLLQKSSLENNLLYNKKQNLKISEIYASGKKLKSKLFSKSNSNCLKFTVKQKIVDEYFLNFFKVASFIVFILV